MRLVLPSRRAVRTVAIAALVAVLPACATSTLERAHTADALRDDDVAVVEYTKALREHPDSQDARTGLERAKLRASDAHFIRGQRFVAQGKLDDAAIELQISVDLNPTNTTADQALKKVRADIRAKLAAPAGGETPLETLLDRQPALTVPGYTVPDVKLTRAIRTTQQTSARTVYLLLAQDANLSVTFDSTFRDAPASVRLTEALTLKQALDAVAQATNTFYQVTGPSAIIVVPDNPVKRREYLQEVEQTFYLQNADTTDALNNLRVTGDIRSAAESKRLNSITIRDTPERVALARHILATLDKAAPELVVDVEILEVDRSKLQEYGLQFATNGSAGPNGSVSVQTDPSTVAALRNLTDASVIVTGIPALYYSLLKTDTNTRTLANPSIRMSDGDKGIAEFGTSIPIPNTTLVPVQQSGPNEQAITSFTYQNVGVNITMTPRTHADDDVTLVLDISLTNIAGTGFQSLPELGNRHVTTSIRLHDGETNILAGLIREDDTTERDGLPGLSSLPGLGQIFSKNQHQRDQTDVVVMLTPHILRPLALTEDDLRPTPVPRDGTSLSAAESGPAATAPIVRLPDPAPAATPLASFPVTPGAPDGLPIVVLGSPVVRR